MAKIIRDLYKSYHGAMKQHYIRNEPGLSINRLQKKSDKLLDKQNKYGHKMDNKRDKVLEKKHKIAVKKMGKFSYHSERSK